MKGLELEDVDACANLAVTWLVIIHCIVLSGPTGNHNSTMRLAFIS